MPLRSAGLRFSDHFSGHAAAYAQARPTYPAALFGWLADQCLEHHCAWDAGCGNGQATIALAAHFDKVIGTDPSSAQLASAPTHAGVEYRCEPAESPSLADSSVDLVVVAQAMHWFDQSRFHPQVARVLRPQGVFAAFTYALCRVEPAVDAVLLRLYKALDPHWPDERRHVENGYRDLPFPYRALDNVPDFAMQLSWTLPQFVAYLGTWSAAQRCLRDTGRDAVLLATPAIADAWGDPDLPREVDWPLSLRVGRLMD